MNFDGTFRKLKIDLNTYKTSITWGKKSLGSLASLPQLARLKIFSMPMILR